MSENEQRVKDLFNVHQSPLTETRICELLQEDDASEVLTILVENKTLQKHNFAQDLVLYWPTHWYPKEAPQEKEKEREKEKKKEKEKEKEGEENEEKEEKAVKEEKEEKKKEEKSPEKECKKHETPSTPMAPPPQPQKVNHLSTPSSSLKARLARRKRPTTPTSTNKSNNTTPSSSPSSSPSPTSSPQTTSPTTSTTSSNITDITNMPQTNTTTTKTKEAPKSWLTTPSPKRRKVALHSPKIGSDLSALEKEKKRLEELVIQKESLLKKKQGTKTAGKEKKGKEKEDKLVVNNDKQLDAQIHKWREGCQQMLIDLQQTTKRSDGTGGVSLGQMMDMFQFERSLFPDFQEDADCFG